MTDDPIRQPSQTPTYPPTTLNTRPVTAPLASLASQTTNGLTCSGASGSNPAPIVSDMPAVAVSRVLATGAIAFTVTPYRPSSIAAITVRLAIPPLAAP